MNNKKKLAGKVLNVSPNKVRFRGDALEDVKKAITRSDFRGLIAVGKIFKSDKNLSSHAGARKIAAQKRKGRQKGSGSRKGSKHSVVSRKEQWIAKVRAQRSLLKELRDKGMLSKKDYQDLYSKSKGGFFRNKRHIKLYLKEHNLIQSKEPKLTG